MKLTPRRQVPRESYVSEADVLAAIEARAALRGPADVMPLLREHLLMWGDSIDEDVPTDRRYGPMRRASEGLRKLLVSEMRRAGVKNVPAADHALFAQVAQGHQSALVDKLKQRRGIDTKAERNAWRERKDAERLEQAREDIPGEDGLPFALTDTQRSYIAKVRTSKDRPSVGIVAHDPETKAVRIKIVWRRAAWRASVDNVRRRWVYPTPQAAREAREAS